MELTKEEILTFLRDNKQLFKEKFDVDNIMLFGSYARGEATNQLLKIPNFLNRIDEEWRKIVDLRNLAIHFYLQSSILLT